MSNHKNTHGSNFYQLFQVQFTVGSTALTLTNLLGSHRFFVWILITSPS